MLKIKKNTSAYISLVLAVLALVVLIAIWATLPYIVDYFYSLFKGRVDGKTQLLAALYAASLPVALADILLIRLLLLVRAGRTFSPEAVGSLRGISWCCLFEGAYLIFVGIFMFDPAAVSFCMLAFAAVFLGIVLRVVKNVFEEATAIKTENDYTI